MKIPKFAVLQITTIYLKSYILGRKSHNYVHVIEPAELSSHPLQRPHRHSFCYVSNTSLIGSRNHLADVGLSTDSDILQAQQSEGAKRFHALP